MAVLVFAEQRENRLRKAAKEAVCRGRALAEEMGCEAAVLLAGNDISQMSEDMMRYGVHKVYLADDPGLAFYRTEAYAAVLEEAVKRVNPTVVLMAHSAMSKDLAPRVAQRLEAGLLSDCVDLTWEGGELLATRPVYAGKALSRMKILTPLKFITLRPNSFPVKEIPGQAEINVLDISPGDPRARLLRVDAPEGEGPELTEADIIVSGGRGLGDASGFELLERLARLLNAAVGASRSAVDAGWKSHQHQVGQTGKVVSPKLYIALGISGAIQHIAGMGTSKCIVAVNNDPEASIFKLADYGIVGDLYEVVPIIIERLESDT